MRLTDVFPGLTDDTWPWDLLNEPGFHHERSSSVLTSILEHLILSEVDMRVDGGVVALTAKLSAASTFSLTFGTIRFPSFEFDFTPGSWSSDFRASVGPGAAFSFEIDELPLTLHIPGDMLFEHPNKPAATAGVALASSVVETSTIAATFRLRVENRMPRLDAHLPISIGPCTFMGIPMLAIHDLQLLLTPQEAHLHYDWIVRPLEPDKFPLDCGGIGIGGLEIDWEVEQNPLRDLRALLHITDRAEWVFEDVVLPAAWLPLPQHGTFGLRRSLLRGERISDYLLFDHHIVTIGFGDHAELHLDQLFFRTPPPESNNLLDGLSIEGGISVPYNSEGHRLGIGLGIFDGDVIRLTLERTQPDEEPFEQWPILNLEFFDAVNIDIVRLRIGVSAKALAEGKDVGSILQVLGDIRAMGRSSESTDGAPLSIAAADGGPFEVALVDVGWDRGTIKFNLTNDLNGTIRLGPFALTLGEFGFVQEQGATYWSMSGGVIVAVSPFVGAVFFRGLRFKIAGNPDASDWGLEGIGGSLKIVDVVSLEFYGYYKTEILTNGDLIKEHGLVGALVLSLGDISYGLTFDLMWGTLVPASGSASSDYFLIQILFEAQLTLATAELRQIRVLLAKNMLPALDTDERAAGELVYYEWLKRTNPTGPNRASPAERLDAWKATNRAIAFGMGFGVSFVGCGSVVVLQAFGLGFDSETAAGLVIALEVFMFKSTEPIALGVFEYDPKSGAFVLLIAFDISLDRLISGFPRDLEVSISGTIVFGNKPGLVAFGRFDDEDTWLGAKVSFVLAEIVGLDLHIALCFEWLENVHVAFGFIAKLSLMADLGVIRLEGWGALGFRLKAMTSGTGEFAARLSFELGLVVVLFGFLRLGLVLGMLGEWLAHTPDYFAFRFMVRIETPFFLPDVSFSIDHVEGSVSPATRPMIAAPLLSASANTRTVNRGLAVARADGLGPDARPLLLSIEDLREARAATYVEPGEGVSPVPLQASVAIEFNDTVADMLGLGARSTAAAFGRQASGEDASKLEVGYELVGLELRRRPLAGGGWTTVELLDSSHDARKLRWEWDEDKRVGDSLAPKRLLLNGSTPFLVALEGPEVDEAILRDNPSFPCCVSLGPNWLRFDVLAEPRGPLSRGFVRAIEDSPILVRGGPCVIREPVLMGAGGPDHIAPERIAAFSLAARDKFWQRKLLVLASREELAQVNLRLAVSAREPYTLHIRACDAAGELVDAVEMHVVATLPFRSIEVRPPRPFRVLELVAGPLTIQAPDSFNPQIAIDVVELDHLLVLTERARLEWERDEARCARRFAAPLPEPINFLPQQEYELVIRTRISASHTTTDPEYASLEERISFVTAGPPGLNEVEAVGEELQPHVRSAHAGGRGLLYREEPVGLVLDEELRLFGVGTPGEDEHGLRLPAVLSVRPQIEAESSREQLTASFEQEEWFAANRREVLLLRPWVLRSHHEIAATAKDPRKLRMRDIQARSLGDCPPDPVWNESLPVFWALPFGRDGGELWQRARRYRASLRREGAAVVWREPFVAADVTALRGVVGGWRVDGEGRLAPTAADSVGYFGEPEWDHLRIEMTVDPPAAGSIGVLVCGAPEEPERGLRFVVTGGQLVAARGRSGRELRAVPLHDPPETITMIVETFADQIRCTAGGQTLRILRLGYGPGACAVLASGGGVRALHVRGIELYGFEFETSRYAGFAEHVHSFTGLERMTLEPGTRPLAELRSELEDVMAPEVGDGERERLFLAFAEALALPLRELVERVHLTKLEYGGEHALLLESPEPMDFVEEIELELTRQRRMWSLEMWVPEPVAVIQNAPGTKALIIPADVSLPAGRRRMTLAITRRWVDTGEAPTPETAYMRRATIEFTID